MSIAIARREGKSVSSNTIRGRNSPSPVLSACRRTPSPDCWGRFSGCCRKRTGGRDTGYDRGTIVPETARDPAVHGEWSLRAHESGQGSVGVGGVSRASARRESSRVVARIEDVTLCRDDLLVSREAECPTKRAERFAGSFAPRRERERVGGTCHSIND